MIIGALLARCSRVLKSLHVAILALAAVVPVTACGGPTVKPPTNRTVVLLDLSGSFRPRVGSALQQIQQLLSEMSGTELHRWERDSDRVSLVALDALPAVIWEGTLPELKDLSAQKLGEIVAGRSDYAGCTDVEKGFDVASQKLKEGPDSSAYLFVFSDLIDEPATNSLSSCLPARIPSLPPAGMPWDRLADVSVSVFWMPPVQKLVWQREIDKLGLGGSFRTHTASESIKAALVVPPRPVIVVTDDDRKQAKDRLVSGLRAVGLVAVVILVLGAGALIVLVRLGRSRQSAAARQPVRRVMTR